MLTVETVFELRLVLSNYTRVRFHISNRSSVTSIRSQLEYGSNQRYLHFFLCHYCLRYYDTIRHDTIVCDKISFYSYSTNGNKFSCYPPFASIAKGEVFGLLYVCLFVCSSTISRQPAGRFTPKFACRRTLVPDVSSPLLGIGGPRRAEKGANEIFVTMGVVSNGGP